MNYTYPQVAPTTYVDEDDDDNFDVEDSSDAGRDSDLDQFGLLALASGKTSPLEGLPIFNPGGIVANPQPVQQAPPSTIYRAIRTMAPYPRAPPLASRARRATAMHCNSTAPVIMQPFRPATA